MEQNGAFGIGEGLSPKFAGSYHVLFLIFSTEKDCYEIINANKIVCNKFGTQILTNLNAPEFAKPVVDFIVVVY